MSAPVEGPRVWRRDLSELASQALPLGSLGPEVLDHLRRPFSADAVKWKVQSEWTSGALIVAYIDARLVYERLNLVWPWWRPAFDAVQNGLRCTLTLYDPFQGPLFQIERSDIGQGGDPKTLNSDAVKRAAVGLGVGLSIYALKQVKLNVGSGERELRTIEKNKKVRDKWEKVRVPVIDARTEAFLRDGYERRLEATFIDLFGPVLDHGDEPGSQGLDTDSPIAAAAETGGDPVEGAGAAADEPEPLQDERAVELRTMAEGLYGQYRKLAPRKLTPADFQSRLRAASGSHEALEAFVAGLEEALEAERAEAERA